MIFALEAIRAGEGDALLLHYGTTEEPRFALVDGGPTATWSKFVRPALAAHATAGPLDLAWVAISHVDGDHVGGLLRLFSNIGNGANPVALTDFLFVNSPVSAAAIRATVNPLVDHDAVAAMPASYPQAVEIIRDALAASIELNPPTNTMLLSGTRLPTTHTEPVTIDVIAPTANQLHRMLDEWIAKLGESGGILPAGVDTSVTNLSSVVLLCTLMDGAKDRSMLLCGDALDTDIIAGLEALRPTENGAGWEFDIVKLPHHGSENNNHIAWFHRVHARHYVISANGRHNNPDLNTITWLVEANKNRRCTIWLTTPEGTPGDDGVAMDERIAALRQAISDNNAQIDLQIIPKNANSVLVNALD